MDIKINGKTYTILNLNEVDDVDNPPLTMHFFNTDGWEWWVCAGERLPNNDIKFFGIGKIFEKEMGFFTLCEITDYGAILDKDYTDNIGLHDII